MSCLKSYGHLHLLTFNLKTHDLKMLKIENFKSKVKGRGVNVSMGHISD